MADKLISQLGARAAVLTTDLMPLEPNAGPPAEKATIAQLITLLDTIYAPITGGAYVLKAGDTMTGLLTIAQATANTSALISTGYSLTGANAQSLIDLDGTWNTSGTPTALKINITDTSSNAASLLLDLQRSGVSKFKVNLDTGAATVANSSFVTTLGSSGGAGVGDNFTALFSGAAKFSIGGNFAVELASDIPLLWHSGTDINAGGADLMLTRDAADTFAQRRTTNAQAFRWYRTFTDASNYERGALQTAAGQVIVAAETAGTGTDDIDLVLTPAGVGRVTLPGGAVLLKTTAALTDVAAAALGTLTNAPTAGNPIFVTVNSGGTLYGVPMWPL